MMHHPGGQRGRERGSLNVEVTEHGVGPPPTNQLDEVCIHPGAKEGHGAGGAEGAGFHGGG